MELNSRKASNLIAVRVCSCVCATYRPLACTLTLPPTACTFLHHPLSCTQIDPARVFHLPVSCSTLFSSSDRCFVASVEHDCSTDPESTLTMRLCELVIKVRSPPRFSFPYLISISLLMLGQVALLRTLPSLAWLYHCTATFSGRLPRNPTQLVRQLLHPEQLISGKEDASIHRGMFARVPFFFLFLLQVGTTLSTRTSDGRTHKVCLRACSVRASYCASAYLSVRNAFSQVLH
jgi:hypothetical protein